MQVTSDLEIGEFFDRCADKRLMYGFEPDEEAKLRGLFQRWALPAGARVLEPGCGSGRLTQLLAERVGPAGEVWACDLSARMIALAKDRGLPKHAHFVHGSTLSVDRPDGWFDAVICLNVLPHITDKMAAFKEYARILRPGGTLWVNHLQGRDPLNKFHHQAAPEVAAHTLPCPRYMRRLMEENGFDLVEIVDIPDLYSAHGARSADRSKE